MDSVINAEIIIFWMVMNQDAVALVLEEVQQCVVKFQDVANTKRRNKKSFLFTSLKSIDL